jgi:hypothetical protein
VIHITKTGFKCMEWNADLQDDVEEEFDPLQALRDEVEIEEGVTLGDIITFTHNDGFLRNFFGGYSTCNIRGYYNELQLGVDPPGDLKYITAAMQVEVIESPKHQVKKCLQMGMNVYGRDSTETHFGIDFCSMREIGGLPFRIEPNASLTISRKGEHEYEAGFEYTPSFLEVLDAIFYEISFIGSSVDKAELKDKLQGMAKQIEDGTATLVRLSLDEEDGKIQ